MKKPLFISFAFLPWLGLIGGAFMIAKRQWKNSLITTATFAFLVGLVFTPLANAGGHGGGGGSPDAITTSVAPTPPTDPRILVHSIDLANNQLTMMYMINNTKHVYTLDGGTNILVLGRPGALQTMTVGMQVKNYVERDSNTLDSIEVGTAAPAPKLAKK